ncbi:MAG: AAA family ATPase [Candidatus Marsarchaeota archaeon]|nr:AAA family ATPase [Candidatus Marsarchaeota archaeon]MCL5418383.1 AAA family ATPase [Candidatus Marsarchaeota archaeon]
MGKSFFSKELAKHASMRIVEVNDIVKKHKLYSYIDKNGAAVVKVHPLSNAIRKEAAHTAGHMLIVGHLVPELSVKFDIIVVLRYDPVKLVRRLEKRDYGKEKIRENVIAEAIDYCGNRAKARHTYSEVYEIDASSTSQREKIIAYIKKRAAGTYAKKPAQKEINSMPALVKIAKRYRYGI